MNPDQDDWDTLIDKIVFAHNTTCQTSTKCIPFRFMFACEASLLIEAEISPEQELPHEDLPFDEKLKQLSKSQKKFYEFASRNIHQAQEWHKCQYDAKHNTKTISSLRLGDKVLMKKMKNKSQKRREA